MPTEIKLPALGENLTEGDVLDVQRDARLRRQQGPDAAGGRGREEHRRGAVAAGRQDRRGSRQEGRSRQGRPGAVPAGRQRPPCCPPRRRSRRRSSRRSRRKRSPPPRRSRSRWATAKRSRSSPTAASPAGRGERGREKLVPAGPATRRLARELGVDLRQVTGSGPGGRVTEEDVKGHVRQIASGMVAPTIASGGGPMKAPPLPDFGRLGADRGEAASRPFGGARRSR